MAAGAAAQTLPDIPAPSDVAAPPADALHGALRDYLYPVGTTVALTDSIPLVAITGQVYSKYIGKMAFQETDFYGMTLPVVKHSYLVMDVHELPKIFKEAFHLARTGRPGPVIIDLPKDVQQAKFQPVFPPTVEFRNPYATATQVATDEQLQQVLGLQHATHAMVATGLITRVRAKQMHPIITQQRKIALVWSALPHLDIHRW